MSWEVFGWEGKRGCFFNLKEAWPEAPNDEQQPVIRAECFGESRGIVLQFSALEVPSRINLKCGQSFQK